jgi:hypothetical protein
MEEIIRSILQYCLNNKTFPEFLLTSKEWQGALRQLLSVIHRWALQNPELARNLLFPGKIVISETPIIPGSRGCPECPEPLSTGKTKKTIDMLASFKKGLKK